MKIEFEHLNGDTIYDCCIIGAGPAGITVARKLSSSGFHILLLEGGDEEITAESQEIYEGSTFGDTYFDLDVTRLRFFGGSSNHWEGMCRPLDEHDFSSKSGFKTGWPISKKDIDPYLSEASSILEINEFPEEKQFAKSGFNIAHFEFSPPVRFFDKYYDEVVKNKNISLVLGGNVTSLETSGEKITSAVVESFSGKKTNAKAKIFIVATGGIENSRLLLWSNVLSSGQVVKNDKMLGRFWTEHPDYTIGSAIMKDEVFENNIRPKSLYLAPTHTTIVDRNILNCGLRLMPSGYGGSKELIAELACVAPTVGHGLFDLLGKNLVCGYKLRSSWEQLPTLENGIRLGDELDAFGVPKTELYWKKTEVDLHTVREAAMALGEYLAEQDLGRIMLSSWVFGDADYPDDDDVIAGNHHMGGTAMSDNPENGIVDANSKVFGQKNLYVVGSSIFPSGGYSNPTLSIIQLSLKLSDHLKPLLR